MELSDVKEEIIMIKEVLEQIQKTQEADAKQESKQEGSQKERPEDKPFGPIKLMNRNFSQCKTPQESSTNTKHKILKNYSMNLNLPKKLVS
mmetsp:Transcript_5755/g.5224  ORF Transcript_5755/g.5224 Transcript_5755/m.5224 type:complete len:91 (+) Transcript_5755:67-339(+)